MGRIRLDTFIDFFLHGYILRFTCKTEGCGHTRDFQPAVISLHYIKRHSGSEVEDAERRARCTKCGQRNCSIVPIDNPAQQPPTLGQRAKRDRASPGGG